MHDYYKLKEKVCKELEEYAEKDKFSMSDIEILDKLTNTAKNIDKLIMYEDGGSSEYSYRSMRSYDGRSYDGRSYDDYSGRRGRDSMGRFVSRDDGRSYADRSYGKDSMISKLNHMMEEAEEKSDKDAIRRCLSQIQNG